MGFALLSPASGVALGRLADVQILDRARQQVLPVYWHDGRYYVAGEPRAEYEIRLTNQQGRDLLAVVAVDGVNVVSGETANWRQTGYVLAPWSTSGIAGWRKSLDHTAAFYFTKLRDSYAARTDRPRHVGVIGVALFESRYRPEPLPAPYLGRESGRASPEPGDASGTAVAPGSKARDSARLGTGHGRSEYAPARYADFERAADTPGEIVVIYYDSHRNLVRRGIIPHDDPRPIPEPFPGRFAPDPWRATG